jgi:stringent starvation protein B
VFSFKGKPEQCFVPWQRVFALVGTDGKGMVYKADMPAEIQEKVNQDQELRAEVENNTAADEEPKMAVVKARKNGEPLRYVRQGNVVAVDFKSNGKGFPGYDPPTVS